MVGSSAHASPRASGLTAVAIVSAIAVVSALNALPWVYDGFPMAQVLGMAAPLAVIHRLRGWRGEIVVMGSAVTSLAIAFHWAPSTIAAVLDGSEAVGLLFAIPILLWDAARVSLPFWVVARAGWQPRSSWLPVGLVMVASEGFFPAVFPWRLGYSQVDWPLMIQSADLLGSAALTLAVLAMAGLVVEMACLTRDVIRSRFDPSTARPVRPSPGGIAACVVVLLNLAYGAWALERYRVVDGPTVRVVAVQVDPDDSDGLEALRKFSESETADLVIWPECSGGCYEASLDSLADAAEVHRLSRGERRGWRPAADEHGLPPCPLLFGAEVFEGRAERPTRVYRSSILLDPSGHVIGEYRKRWLMPFGEYVPAARALPVLVSLFQSDQPLATGNEPTVLDAGPDARIGTLMCYEDMLPEAAASLARSGATLLVSLVNASSFPNPTALSQHRRLAQMRAVENRRALVRCGATGETCVIDPRGIIGSRLPLRARGGLVADAPLRSGVTLATRTGEWIAIVSAFAAAAILSASGDRRKIPDQR